MRRYTLFIKILIRSFFVQSGWNYKSLLSIGFCFAILPVAQKLYGEDKEKYNQFVKRHLGFFNAHPYFASFALGAVARLEEDVAENRLKEDQLVKFKNALIGPLGALGDRLFWAIIKPATFSLGVLGFLLLNNLTDRLTFLVLLAMLYNAPHLYVRVYGILQGYQKGFSVCKNLNVDHFKRLKNGYLITGITAVGLIAGFFGATRLGNDPWAYLVFIGSVITAVYFKSKKAKTYLAMLLPLLIALIVGIINNYI